MKVKIDKGTLVVYNNWLPIGYKAMNFCGIIFAKSELNDRDMEHESVHSKQIVEVGVMFAPIWVTLSLIYSWWFVLLFPTFYYAWYGVEWLTRLLKLKDAHKAYKAISFEREAYAYQHLHYKDCNNVRVSFRWLKYIYKK